MTDRERMAKRKLATALVELLAAIEEEERRNRRRRRRRIDNRDCVDRAVDCIDWAGDHLGRFLVG